MSSQDEAIFARVGREVCQMIQDLENGAGDSVYRFAYTRRRITYHGGSAEMFLVSREALGDIFERAAAAVMDVALAAAPSEAN